VLVNIDEVATGVVVNAIASLGADSAQLSALYRAAVASTT
jgi:hypothetical protein